MKNSKALFQELANLITIDESKDEIHSLVYLILEHHFSVSKTQILAENLIDSGNHDLDQVFETIKRVNNNEPIQYILGKTEFYGRQFEVNPSVLIPRPETEELIGIAKKYANNKKKSLSIVDIGTGSGCIPITLALEIPNANIFATDVSEQALITAKHNASDLNAQVSFALHDILKQNLVYTDVDIIVSNPPYITEKEKPAMNKNVLAYEPHLALFVSDADPLLFYKAIATKAKIALTIGGLLAVEINEQFGNEVAQLFDSTGFRNVEIVKDINGKDRFVTGLKAPLR
jgi:release factor glutamine methyltransferase